MAISDNEVLKTLYEVAGTQPYKCSLSHVTTKGFEPLFKDSKKPEFVLSVIPQYKRKQIGPTARIRT